MARAQGAQPRGWDSLTCSGSHRLGESSLISAAACRPWVQPGAEKASFTPALDPACSDHTHSRPGWLRHGMQPHAHLRPWVDPVTGTECVWPGSHTQVGRCAPGHTHMCPQTGTCRETTTSTQPRTHAYASGHSAQADSTQVHVQTHRHFSAHTGAHQVSMHPGTQGRRMHKQSHVLLAVHPDTAQLVDTSAP